MAERGTRAPMTGREQPLQSRQMKKAMNLRLQIYLAEVTALHSNRSRRVRFASYIFFVATRSMLFNPEI